LTGCSKDEYAISRVYVKPYAACRHSHPAIEAALALIGRGGIRTSIITHINVRTYRLAAAGHDHTDIDGAASAKMSTPYGVAAAIIYGKAGISEFSDAQIKNAEVLELAKRVTVIEDEELNALVPGKRPAVVEIVTESGSFIHRVDLAKGEPETPMADDEILAKFRSMLDFAGKSAEYAQRLADGVKNLESSPGEIFNALQGW
jgi:2-methylcitrate dehydratase PrpD